jgi:hypothetical protein
VSVTVKAALEAAIIRAATVNTKITVRLMVSLFGLAPGHTGCCG